jgi:hypothetical protein
VRICFLFGMLIRARAYEAMKTAAADLNQLECYESISLEPDKEISLAPEVQVCEMLAMSHAETALQPSKEKEQEGGA